MRQVLLTLAVLAGLGLAGAAAVVGFGLYNVSAQVGHLPGVSWVLHTTFRNSVRLRAPSMETAPDLADPELIALGAGHVATACAPCHATPDTRRNATMRAMSPAPPRLREAIGDWAPNELHWIVENGVKMSGMPAWPAKGRADEVWSVVAYLVAIRSGTAPPAPRMPPETDPQAYCASCHTRIGGRVPRLDILSPAYIEAQLQAYLIGTRHGGIMAQAASLVPRDRLAPLARAFAARPDRAPMPVPDPALAARGAALARTGTRDIPACLACHDGPAPARGPVLDGQRQPYLEIQLRLWRDGILDHDPLMQAASRALDEDGIRALAAYFASRRP
ncbi:c-type cytochrome [Marinibacterium profundimaris]|uniref:Cytochrome C n=1 Tax=Marinibacterium profundimaris TaxID=1679460 RepID=A0A225NAM4_9RHOB|nr:c-type cytochrome [Marinibacterium profundimaris]OWU66989.1 cytochrome C [Marinibacterium profundimaris]